MLKDVAVIPVRNVANEYVIKNVNRELELADLTKIYTQFTNVKHKHIGTKKNGE